MDKPMTAEALEALAQEYRLTMDRDIVHSWAGDAARALDDIAAKLRTGHLVYVDDGAVERATESIMWHAEQCLGPISREVCENPGDDDYSVLRHNISAAIAAMGGK